MNALTQPPVQDLSPIKVWGEFFFRKKLFMQERFWTNLCGVNLKVVHWCVDVDDVDVHWCIDVDDKFSKPCKSYLEEDIISSMIQDSKYCSDVMKKRFNK